ncbi:MAG: lysine biosynthesis protein LysX [Phycisphaeraceae bacterium]|nr:lysine biosynthesis protein LysX [Phycisphaerales bacterium]MCB9861058.1 lysine biosynthesis protein LysX [Phycisphaeraceae bacterium]
MRVAMLHTRMRTEERLLVDAFEARGANVELVDIRPEVFRLDDMSRWTQFDVVFDRSLSLTTSITTLRMLDMAGVRCVNHPDVVEVCSDKLRTTLALERAGVPNPRTRIALSPEAALEAIRVMGFPVVLKPTVGSWGRMVSRINDMDAAEAIIEHRDVLGSVQHHVYYIQEHIDKPDRDLRVFVVGGEPIAAIARYSEHWVTNTARGGSAQNEPLTDELVSLARRVHDAVGGDAIAIDLLECPNRGLLVNEVNHSMEFRNSIATTGIDIPGRIVEHIMNSTSVNTPSLTGVLAS